MDRFYDVRQIGAAHAAIEADVYGRFKRFRGREAPPSADAHGALASDVLRYALLREPVAETEARALLARYESDLAERLGNLVQRTLGLVTKLRRGATLSLVLVIDDPLAEAARAMLAAVVSGYERRAPNLALSAIRTFVDRAHHHLDDAAPWAEEKRGDRDRVDAILATTLEALRWIAVVLGPVIPAGSDRLRAALGLAPVEGDAFALVWTPGPSTAGLANGAEVFPRVAADERARLLERLGAASGPRAEPPLRAEKSPLGPADEVSFAEFARLDLRIGTVTACDRIPRSEKLLRLEVAVGPGPSRQIVAGIGKTFAPEEVVGKQVLVVVNLAPMKLMGVESRGMVLAVRGETGGDADLALLVPNAPRPLGARIS